jgi:hypothetical protein
MIAPLGIVHKGAFIGHKNGSKLGIEATTLKEESPFSTQDKNPNLYGS